MVSVVLKCTFYDNVQLKAHLLIDVHGISIFSCTYTILVKRLIISSNGTLKYVRLQIIISAKR